VVVLKTYTSRAEAELAQGILQANGIEALVSSDDAGGMQPWLQQALGVRLLVHHEDALRAAWVLEPASE
jgi:putative signal transducing protein